MNRLGNESSLKKTSKKSSTLSLLIRNSGVQDYPYFNEWLADPRVYTSLTSFLACNEYTPLAHQMLLRQGRQVLGTVELRGKPVGLAGLYDIDQHHRTAKILIAFSDQIMGLGLSFRILNEFARFGFQELNLGSCLGCIAASNLKALGMAKRAGFREFGRQRNGYRINGKVVDAVWLNYVSDEYQIPREDPRFSVHFEVQASKLLTHKRVNT